MSVDDEPPDPAPDHLFVYGTLRRGSSHPVARSLAREASSVEEGSVAGRLYDLGAYPGAVPSADGSRVRGDVLRLPSSGDVLRLMDRYEGYEPERKGRGGFERGAVDVRLASGSSVTAWIYWYRGALASRSPIRSGDWVAFTSRS